MATHGVVTANENGEVSVEARGGIFNYVADAATTMISHQKVAIGYPALIQRIMLVTLGNVVGVQSTTGRIGMSALGKTGYLAI